VNSLAVEVSSSSGMPAAVTADVTNTTPTSSNNETIQARTPDYATALSISSTEIVSTDTPK